MYLKNDQNRKQRLTSLNHHLVKRKTWDRAPVLRQRSWTSLGALPLSYYLTSGKLFKLIYISLLLNYFFFFLVLNLCKL